MRKVKLSEVIKNYKLVGFYWNGGRDGFLVYIEKRIPKEEIERLIDECAEVKGMLDNVTFVEFLKEKGIDCVLVTIFDDLHGDIDADEWIYF